MVLAWVFTLNLCCGFLLHEPVWGMFSTHIVVAHEVATGARWNVALDSAILSFLGLMLARGRFPLVLPPRQHPDFDGTRD